MHILDIDMDFFQDKIHYGVCDDFAKNDMFLEDDSISVWSEHKIIDFLENTCGLSKEKKIPGKILKNHVEAYMFWRDLIDTKQLHCPFEVTHIDAHADLGFPPSPDYSQFLQCLDESCSDRFREGIVFEEIDEIYLNSANYLLAAVISKWVNKIKYVYHPEIGESFDFNENIVKNIIPSELFMFNFCEGIKKENILLQCIDMDNTDPIKQQYDYVSFALSPQFVKEEMKLRLDIVQQYIDII